MADNCLECVCVVDGTDFRSVSSVKEAEFCRTHVIDRVFSLLVKMIEALQNAAARQSDRLQFLTQWQKGYTDQLDQIHSFTRGNGDSDAIAENNSNDARDVRDDLNKVNSTYTEQVRSRRSIVSDDAKALQTNVNQTSDAVNQQTNMATALLQQLSTILGQIFR